MPTAAFDKALRKATAPLYTMANRSTFELDSGFIEVKSNKHRNATISSIASEVRAREAEVLKRGRELAPPGSRVALLPRAQVLSDGTATYGGSFHAWITLPHVPGPGFDHAAFVRGHSRLVSTMQHLEPLLLACMPMDPRAPGSGDRYSRASMRSRMNWLSGFAVAKMPQAPEPRRVLCHGSLESLNAGEDPVVVKTSEVVSTTKSGAKINLLACVGQGRWSERRQDWNSGSGVQSHNAGTDFRFDTCWGCDKRREDHVAYYRDAKGAVCAASKGKNGKWAPAKACSPNMTGVEFRVFDHLMIPHEDLLGIVVLVAASAKASETPEQEPAWMTQMLRCARYGSRVPVSAAYWRCLRKAFGLKDASELPPHAHAALNAILADAFQAHGKTTTARRFGLQTAPTFPDVNFASWKSSVEAMKARDESLKSKLARVAEQPDSLVKELGAGWIPDMYAIAARE
jgi:hypothetical protein